MKILVFGQTGQVARALAALQSPKHTIITLNRNDADLMAAGECAAQIAAIAPDAVINAAAFTNVDLAEQESANAHQINVAAPAEMAKACFELQIPFVNISSDYVFSGDGATPWMPDEVTAPVNAYGQSKQEGEVAVASIGGCFVNLRTSWVFSAHGHNFVKSMLRLGTDRDELSIVADQIGGPTSASDIASACLRIVEQLGADPDKAGTYHFSGAPDTSWAHFARAIFEACNVSCTVKEIPSHEFPTLAVRPLNSRLNCDTTRATFGIERPNWHESLTRVLKELRQ